MALFIVTLVNLIIGFAALCVFYGYPRKMMMKSTLCSLLLDGNPDASGVSGFM